MKIFKAITAFLIVALFCTTICKAQSPQPTTLGVPDQVPPPADAAVLGKYGDVPLNMNAGVPDISVPFYEIKTSKLSLPITLNYDATGIKVDQIASWVGLGWSLSAGGVITRTVNGTEDLGGYLQRSIPPMADDIVEDADGWNYLDLMSPPPNSQGWGDSKPDYFFYNFLGHSGQFVFGEDKTPIDLHHQEPLKIQYTLINGVKTFNILDGSGNQYVFAANQNDNSYYVSAGATGHHNAMSYVSSWYLSQIISCDKTDTLSLSYYQDGETFEKSNNYSLVYNDQGAIINGAVQPKIISNGLSSQSFVVSHPLRLQSITFRNGKVTFYSSGPRQDVAGNKLDSMVVSRFDFQSKSYKPVKSINLFYDYYQTNSKYRLRLDSLKITGSSAENGGKYAFDYDPNPLPEINSNGRDLFGYYNGKNDNTTLVPDDALTAEMKNVNEGLHGGDRNTYNSYLQHGILQRVYYPTSGYTEFSFEPNKYHLDVFGTQDQEATASCGNEIHHDETTFTPAVTTTVDVFYNISAYAGGPKTYGKLYRGSTEIDSIYVDPYNGASQHKLLTLTGGVQYKMVVDAQTNSTRTTSALMTATWTEPDTTIESKDGGGLRVTAVKNYDNAGNFLDGQIYKYGINEDGYGELPTNSTMLNTFNQHEDFYYGIKSSPDDLDCSAYTANFNVFNASSIYDSFTLSSQAVSYPEVSKYQVDKSGNYLGKSVFDYSVYKSKYVSAGYFSSPEVTSSGFIGGKLLQQSDFTFNDDSFVPVKRTVFRYDSLDGARGRGLRVERNYNVNGCYIIGTGSLIEHKWRDVPIYSGSVLPVSQITYDYDQNDPTKYVTTKRTFTYNSSANLQPVTTTDENSDGTSTITKDQYPEDKAGISNLTSSQSAALDQLVLMHNLLPVIQKTVKRDDKPVSVIKNDYKKWTTNQVYLDSIEAQTADSPIETRVVFSDYDDDGNLLQAAKKGGTNDAYLWDYNNQYPIAEVKNASQGAIAYTSFEADGTGNWTVSSSSRSTGGLSGKLSFPLSGKTVSKTGLSASATYIVSYWTTGSSPLSIAGTISGYPIKGATINGWTYYEHQITGRTSVSLTTSSTLNIDEVRLYPKDALMKTYTYQPLTGMTGSVNEKSEITTYEFDGLQRLINIKDQNGNVIKHLSYHYQDQ